MFEISTKKKDHVASQQIQYKYIIWVIIMIHHLIKLITNYESRNTTSHDPYEPNDLDFDVFKNMVRLSMTHIVWVILYESFFAYMKLLSSLLRCWRCHQSSNIRKWNRRNWWICHCLVNNLRLDWTHWLRRRPKLMYESYRMAIYYIDLLSINNFNWFIFWAWINIYFIWVVCVHVCTGNIIMSHTLMSHYYQLPVLR